MSGVTLDELCKEVGVTLTQLDKPCTSEHLCDVALFLESWRHVAPHLELSSAEVEAAEVNANSEEGRRLKILKTWKAKFAFKAKYRVLIEALLKIGRADLAEKVCRVLTPQQPIGDHPACLPEAITIIPAPRTPSTLDPLSIQTADVSTPIPAPSVQVEHVPAVESSSALPTHQLVQASGKEVSVVQEEKDMLVSMYDKLVANAVETFSRQQENSPEFFRKLRVTVAVLPTSLKYQHRYFLHHHSSQIAKTTTVEEIFSILIIYCNFLNCSLLAHIIDKFGDEGLRKELSTYTIALKEFRLRTKITDFSKTCAENSDVPPGFATLRMRMGEKWEYCTLEDIEEHRKCLVQDSSVADYALYFMGGVSGSIYLLWSVPDHAVHFLGFVMDQQFCNRHSIELVIIDGKVLEEFKRWDYMDDLKEFKQMDEFTEQLVWASREGCLEDVVYFLSTGVEVNSRGQWEGMTALMMASKYGNLDVVRELLKAQADVNVQDEHGLTALMAASSSGHPDTVRELLSAGAQVDLQNEDGWTALIWASFCGHPDTVRVLLSAGAQVDLQDEHGYTALMLASYSGHTDTVRVLLSAGAQVDLQDEGGWTALIWASFCGHPDTVRVLLSAGAQVDLQSKDGRTALIYAVLMGKTDAVNVLVEGGADVNLQDKNGLTALIYAVHGGETDSVNVLMEGGADVNLQEKTSGRSAIFYGAEKGDLEMVKLLIQGGANLSLKDKDGVTADEVAEVHGHQAVCDELRKRVRVGRTPLSKTVRDRVLATGQLLRALYKRLEEKIFRTQNKELARRTQDLDTEIPLSSTPGRKGVRDPLGHRQLLEYTDMRRSAH